MPYVSHPNIPQDTIEERAYQTNIARHALDGNTLVVLPTGMGKTAVALRVAAERLSIGKILMLAPTKPLVEQHYRYFSKNLLLEEHDVAMFTGSNPPAKRIEMWGKAKLCISTPEVIKNDLIAERYSLHDVSLLIVDECHRTVGNYAYVFIAERYTATASQPLILGMTASPGSDPEMVAEICGHLSVSIVESRVETDADVRAYVHEREIEYRSVDLPEDLWLALSVLNSMIDDRLVTLTDLNYRVPRREALSMKALNGVMAQIQTRMQQRDRTAYTAMSVHAELMKLKHGVTMAESQGTTALKAYLSRLESEGASGAGSKASKRICSDERFQRLLALADNWKKELHPKADEVVRIVRDQLVEDAESRVIVFATYRDGVSMLVNHLAAAGIPAIRFVGQASRDTEKGLSQKEQIEAIRQFREGEFHVLVATSVGEEGLDIPSTDLVVFYESVPSEVRSIQRKGRTGRNSSGKIIVLITKGTTDETFRWVSNTREKQMQKGVKAMRSGNVPVPAPDPAKAQMTLADAVLRAAASSAEADDAERPAIVIDNREMSSKVAEHLSNLGAKITLAALPVGDYAIGDRVLVERKTAQDFVDTLVDRDLFGQVKSLAESASRPVLIVEGGSIADLYELRNIHPNAIRNTLASIAVDFDVSLVFTRDAEETAGMLYAFARRDLGEAKSERSFHRHKSARSGREELEYILTAVPEVGPKSARDILSAFGTLRAVFSATAEELMKVKGVGEKTAGGIVGAAERKYE
ncbi:DEAD/DEAH box helicase [Methanorbis furvi]|uniref:ATP-dependent RNA helicase SrmB n=1 Tax=Methanorbis furvi TaxID=3028299 RepID=A0AAE4MBT6_9EURY|nr:ATP-dependent RNA helicase SrmB [Methanocorpusculaceae archaeon Ag1]